MISNGSDTVRHEKFIRRCLALADESLAAGDLPFGALIEHDGRIIAEGRNSIKVESDITGHAEINAIRKALQINPSLDLSECTLYSSVEPCPMCSFIIRDYGIGRVVYSLPSPHMGGKSRWHILTDNIPYHMLDRAKNKQLPELIGGVLHAEAARKFDELGWGMHKI